MADDLRIKSHVEKGELSVCAYCGAPFAPDEIVIEREIHGRTWRFCCEQCLIDFRDGIDFEDEDIDSYEATAARDPDEREPEEE